MTGAVYINMLREAILFQPYTNSTKIKIAFYLFIFFNKTAAPSHCHPDLRQFPDETFVERWIGRLETFVERWIGRRESVEYSPRSPDLTPLDFFLWGTLKNTVYATKSLTLDAMREMIVTACESVSMETISRVYRSGP